MIQTFSHFLKLLSPKGLKYMLVLFNPCSLLVAPVVSTATEEKFAVYLSCIGNLPFLSSCFLDFPFSSIFSYCHSVSRCRFI